MPKRTRLLASVAMPLISFSLLVPSVHAAMPGVQPPMRGVQSDIIHVQAPPPGPEGAPAEGELKKRPKAAEGQAPAEKQATPEGQGERPAERPRGEPERPRASQGEARPERPAGEPQGGPRAEPQGGAPAEQPRPKRAEPQAEAPARPAPPPRAEEPKPEPQRQAEPEAAKPEPKAEPNPAPGKPAEPAPAERAAPPAEPAQRAAPPAEQPAGERPTGERPAGERPRNEPRNGPRPGDAPQGEPGRPAPAERPAAPPVAPAAPQLPAPPVAPPAAGQPGTPPAAEAPPVAAPPVAPPPAPAAGQRSDAPAPGQPAQAPVVATPKTPQEIERAKVIANDPAKAQGTVVLPVENGAAVLDSAKEAPAAVQQAAPVPGQPGAPGQRRDGQRPGGPGAPGAVPGQAQAPQPAPNTPAPPPPTSDAAAQAAAPGAQPQAPIRMETFSRVQGERLRERPRFEDPRGWEDVRRADEGRVIIRFDNRTIVRHDDSERFISDGYEPEYDRLPGGRTRETYERDGGVQIVTIRNRYGEVIQRSRVGRDGREMILFYAPELADERAERDYRWRDPGAELPPMRLTIPVNQYIIDTTSDPDHDYYRFLEQPPVERVERVYSVDEVRYSARIRDKVRRIDLDTITFATGSADIPMNQATSLRKVADAIKKVLERDPSETFLIEGHTDAVGSDESNLVLSDRRAESVARVLTDAFAIPPENMVTQGYGERYLKVSTPVAEQQNRRVTIRRITALVKPVAQSR